MHLLLITPPPPPQYIHYQTPHTHTCTHTHTHSAKISEDRSTFIKNMQANDKAKCNYHWCKWTNNVIIAACRRRVPLVWQPLRQWLDKRTDTSTHHMAACWLSDPAGCHWRCSRCWRWKKWACTQWKDVLQRKTFWLIIGVLNTLSPQHHRVKGLSFVMWKTSNHLISREMGQYFCTVTLYAEIF